MSKTLSSILKGGTLPVIHGGTGVTISTGTGAVVLSTNPALITPDLGIATATTINKIAFTMPTSDATLTLTGGKTLSVTNTLTFSGTDSSTVTFRTGGTAAYLEDKLSAFTATSSEELASILTDETGTGKVVFSNNPVLISPTIGDASASSVSVTNRGSVKFFESTINGVNFIGLRSPANLAADYTLTLPSSTGLAGQIISTDGNGNLAFTDSDTFGGNCIYVSATKGSDTNDGITSPVRTLKRGLQIASGLVYNSVKAPNGTRVVVNVAAGEYIEDNPIIIPDNVSVIGAALRSCIFRPLNANKDLFRVRNGCYFSEFTFRDGVDANGIASYTWDYAVAFDDVFDTNTDRSGYINLPTTKPLMTLSPYIQNCTALSFLGGNGAYIDGGKIANPNVPVSLLEVEVNPTGAVPVQCKSMVAAAFTMILFGGTAWRVVNEAYVQLVSCFQLFALNGVYTQSGGYASITNSATNFGIYALRSSGFSPTSFTFDRGIVTEVGYSGVNQTLTVIGFTRPDGPVQQYIIRVYSNTANFTYDVDICQRDVGFIIDAIRYDMMFGSNFRSIKAGMSYYTAQSSNVIGSEKDATIAAYVFLRDYIANAVNGDPLAGTSVVNNMNTIINIITNGLSAVPTAVLPEPPTLLSGFSDAARLLYANKSFIQDEVTAYLYANYQSLWTSLTDNQRTLCKRDMGYVVDAIRYDLIYGGNLETAVAARLYKNQLTGVLVEDSSEQAAVTAVYARLKAIIGNILTNNTSWTKSSVAYDPTLCQRDVGFIIDAVRYDMMFGSNFRSIKAGMSYYTAQASAVVGDEKAASIDAFTHLRDYIAAQVSGYSAAATSVTDNMNTIISIINTGLSAVPTITLPEPSNIVASFSNAARIINANKAFIQDEVSGYLLANYTSTWLGLTPAQKLLCKRDMGYIVDAIRYDLIYGGNLETSVCARLYKNQKTGVLVEPALQLTAVTAVYARLKAIIGNILTNNTSWTTSAFVYDSSLCQRDVGFVIDALRYDMMFGSNFRSIKAGMSYYTAQSANLLSTEKAITVDAFTYLRDYLATQVSGYAPAATSVTNSLNTIINIINNGLSVVPAVVLPEPSNILTGFSDAARLLYANKAFIQDEVTAYLNTNYNTLWSGFTQTQKSLCTRDIGYIVDAIRYDLVYGGNLETAVCARLYKNQQTGTLVEVGDQQTALTAVYVRLKAIIGSILTNNTSWTKSTGNVTTQVVSGNAGSTDAVTFTVARLEELRVMVSAGTEPSVISPSTTWVSSNLTTQNSTLVTNKSTSQTAVTTYITSVTGSATQVISGTAASSDAVTFAVARLEELRVMVSTGVEPTVISPSTSWVSSNLTTQNSNLVSNKGASQTEISNYVALRYGAGNGQYISGNPGSVDATAFVVARLEELRIMVSTGTEPSVFEPGVGWVEDTNLVVQSTILQTNKDAIKTFVTDYISTQFGPLDLTSNYKTRSPSYLEVTFNAATEIDIVNDIFTTSSPHGFVNGDAVVYNTNNQVPLGGMFTGSQYYVVFLNTTQFKLAHDNSLSLLLNVTRTSTGLHSIVKNDYELFVDDVIETHHVFQTIVLNNNTYTFVPGQKLEGVTTGQPNSANVYSFDGENTLVVAINVVTIYNNPIRKLFAAGSTITKAGSDVFSPAISVTSVTLRSDLYGATFTVMPSLLDGSLNNINSLPGKKVYFHRPSIVNSSGHTWEYAGSGIDYNALPVNGGQGYPAFQQFEENAGRVYSSGTNELGDFQVGNFITAYNRTGNIVFKNTVTVSQLNVLKLALSDISIDAISSDIGLGENEISGPANNKLSTQLAMWTYLKTRLGSFIDKSVSTNAVPGAVVQLNSAGQINNDLIPAQRAPTALIRLGYHSRLTAYEDVPSVSFIAGDTCTEKFQTVTITLSLPITALDFALVTQDTSGATGYIKGDVTNSTTVVIASQYETFSVSFDTNSAHILTIGGDATPSTTNTSVYCSAVSAAVEANDTNVLRDSSTNQYLVIPYNGTYTYTNATISSVIRYNNIAYVITTAAHNLVTNNQVKVTATTLTSYNTSPYVTVLTTTKFSYPNTDTATTASATTTATATINAASNASTTTGTVASAALSGTINVNDYVFGGGLPLGSIISAVNMSASPRTFTVTFPTTSSVTSTSTAALTFITPVSETGTVNSVITAASSQAQGEVYEVRRGMVVVVNNLTISGGSLYTNGSYSRVALTGGAGSGALANITVTGGAVTAVDLVYAGTGYGIGNTLSASLPVGSGFSITVSTVETRLYINNMTGGQFTGSSNSPDFVTDNNSSWLPITVSTTITKTFNAASAVDYVNNIITINSHGLSNGDPVIYSPGVNPAIGNLSIVTPYYIIVLSANTFRLSTEYNGATYVTLGTSSTGSHTLTISTVNTTNNRIYVASHGLATGDAVTITGSTLPSYLLSGSIIQITDRQTFFIGSVTTNSFTLHFYRADSLVSVSGSTIAAVDFSSTGSNTYWLIHDQVQIIGFSNTSGKNLSNWGLLTTSGVDASNIVSGTISTSRLASSGTANSSTYLRGDSSWATAVASLKSNTSIITLGGTGVSPYYGAVTMDIAKATFPTDNSDYSTMGVAQFNVLQFDVGTGNTAGRVFIKAGVVDAGTLDTYDSSYFLDPANFTGSIPVDKGGTGLTGYTAGDLLYANNASSLSKLAIGPANTILSSNGSLPYWADSLTLATIVKTNSGEIQTVSTGTANVFNTNALSINVGGSASSVVIGASSNTRSFTTIVKNYTTSGSATTSISAVISSALVISTVARNGSNIATIVTSTAHGLTSGDTVTIVCNNTTFNGLNLSVVTVVNTTTFTYANTGTTLSTVAGVGTVYTGGTGFALFTAATSSSTKLTFSGTTGIVIGQLVQSAAGIPSNTLVTGIDATSVYLSNAISTDLTSLTTVVFAHTNTSLGIKAGDQVTIASSGIANLDGTWPVTSAGSSSSSFTVKIATIITLSSSPRVGTIEKINTLLLRNKTVTLGSSEASATPVAATLKGENAVGTNISASDFTITPGLATGTGTTGNFIIKTGAPGTSGDITQSATTRLTIDGNGLATFVNSVVIKTDLEVQGTVVTGITTTPTTIKSFSATTYRSAKFIVQANCTASSGSNLNTYQVAEILVLHNGTNAYMVEYGDISTVSGGAMLATFTCDINSGNVRILAQAAAATDTISVRVISSLTII